MLVIVSIQLCGCKFIFNNGKEKHYAGIVTFNGVGLENVKIKDKINTYAVTDINGRFSFTSNFKTITIFAEKTGYNFSPKTLTLNEETENIRFEARKAKLLTGQLKLDQINFTPTSIISLHSNNFSYNNFGKESVKLCEFYMFFNETQVIANKYNQHIEKYNSKNLLNPYDSFSFNINNGIANFKIKYIIKMYYKCNNNEAVITEPTKILSVDSIFFDSQLDENKYLKISANGINSISSGYSYNISFIFKYMQ